MPNLKDLEVTKDTTNAEIADSLYGEKAKDYLWSACATAGNSSPTTHFLKGQA